MEKYYVNFNTGSGLEKLESTDYWDARTAVEKRIGYTRENVAIYDQNGHMVCFSKWHSMDIYDSMDTIEDLDSKNQEDIEWFKSEYVLLEIGGGYYENWNEE